MKYINGDIIKVGDIFTDGSNGHEELRLKNKAKLLNVDNFILVWFPLNEFTCHGNKYKSYDWGLTSEPKQINKDNLTEEELRIYNNTGTYLNDDI